MPVCWAAACGGFVGRCGDSGDGAGRSPGVVGAGVPGRDGGEPGDWAVAIDRDPARTTALNAAHACRRRIGDVSNCFSRDRFSRCAPRAHPAHRHPQQRRKGAAGRVRILHYSGLVEVARAVRGAPIINKPIVTVHRLLVALLCSVAALLIAGAAQAELSARGSRRRRLPRSHRVEPRVRARVPILDDAPLGTTARGRSGDQIRRDGCGSRWRSGSGRQHPQIRTTSLDQQGTRTLLLPSFASIENSSFSPGHPPLWTLRPRRSVDSVGRQRASTIRRAS